MVVAAQHADVGPRPARPGPIRPSAVVLHVEPAGRVVVPRDLVYALAEFGIRIGRESGADALVGRLERVAAVLAQIVAAGRNTEMHAIAVANDGVHAESAVARLPFARVLVVADAGHHLPRIAAVMAPEQRRRLHAAPQLLLANAGLERPDVDQRPSIIFGKRRPRLRLLEALSDVRRAQHLHAEERIAARGIQARCAARVDQSRIHGDAGTKGAAQREAASRLCSLGDEHALLGADGENDSIRHV